MNGTVDFGPMLSEARLSQPSVTVTARDRPIGLILNESGLVTVEEVERIIRHARSSGSRFGDAAVELGLVSREDLRQVLAYQFNLPLAIAGEHRIDREVIAAHESFHPVIDDLRELRDQLLLRWFSGDGPEYRTIAMIGAGRREGRTFLAANLAVTFAQLGLDVLLVDADLRRGRLHRMFGVDGSVGLSNILSGRQAQGAIVRIEPLRTLSLLPAGGEPPNPADLMVGDPFAEFLRDSATRHDVVILDTPPASAAPEAIAIAARARGNVLVARKGTSRVQTLQWLAGAIGGVGGRVVGTVLSVA